MRTRMRRATLGATLLLGGWTLAVSAGTVSAPGRLHSGPSDEEGSAPWPTSRLSGGEATTATGTRDAFSKPAPSTPPEELRTFAFGNRLFTTSWVEAPGSVDLFDGLGPYFSRRSCSGCHTRDGRGRPPASPGDRSTSMVVKIRAADGRSPHPVYGAQLSERAVSGLEPEGRVAIRWEEVPHVYPDGTPVSLRRPVPRPVELAHGEVGPHALSCRIAPGAFGTGLLEAVPDAAIVAAADPRDADGDGVSGRVNLVRDPDTGTLRPGRYGWKATQPSVRGQVTAALIGDMGLTTTLHPAEELTAHQPESHDRPRGGDPEVDDRRLAALVDYTRLLAVPARRDVEDPVVRRGADRFDEVGCTGCHTPTWVTADDAHPALAGQTIHPYTDLLLHDLGDDLADGVIEGTAEGGEWRTAPLWGLGLAERVNGYRFLLHDGRARTPEEAILWHGGEASGARDAFRRLDATDRAALLAFLESL